MNHYLLVGMGGAAGAIIRFAMMHFLPATIYGVPVQIMIINVIGCFCIGSLTEVLEFMSGSYALRMLLTTGLLGGFTTFSAFSIDFAYLSKTHAFYYAIIFAIFSVTIALLAFFVGAKLTRFIFN